MENNTLLSNILIIVIIILLIVYLAILNTRKINNQKEKEFFKNRDKEAQEKLLEGECENMNSANILYTPTAVNVPFIDHYPKPDPPVFTTGGNYEDKPADKITGKYCFPIEKFMYDGIWNSHVTNCDKSTPEKQVRNWDFPNHKPNNGVYCGDKLLILPEKTLQVGDEIVSSDNCAKFYPKPEEVEEKIRACTNKETGFRPTEFEKTGLIRTTNGKWNINGL